MKQKTTGWQRWAVGVVAALGLVCPAATAQTPGGPCIKDGLATTARTPQACLQQGGTWLVSLGGDRINAPLAMGGDQLPGAGSLGASGGRSDLDAGRFPSGDVETGDATNAHSTAASSATTPGPTPSAVGQPTAPSDATPPPPGGTAGTSGATTAGPAPGGTAGTSGAATGGSAGAVGERHDDAVTRQQIQAHQGTGHTGDVRGQGAVGGIGSAPGGGATPGSAAGVDTGATSTAHGTTHTAGSTSKGAH